MVFALFEGKKIFYRTEGEGAPVLLLHGFMEDHSIWNNWKSQLSKKYKLILPDLPGHALSETIGASHSMQKLAMAMWTLLAYEGIRNATIVGHSLGGYVALEMAKLKPQRTHAVCLLHSTALDDTDIKKKERDRVIKVLELNSAIFIKEAIPNLFAPDLKNKFANEINALTDLALTHNPLGLIATTRGMRDRENNLPWLQQTHIPVHFIIGKKDPVIPFEFYNEQISAGNHVTHFISDKAGHMGFIEDENAVFKSMTEFISKYAI
jgi:pimeloyl-ACP methyl ester carboxylesterase